MNTQFIFPMYALVVLAFVVALTLLYRRIISVKKGEMSAKRFKTLSFGESPAYVLQAERHFINLFEVPVLFFPACIIALLLPIQSQAALPLAWAFVGFRTVQAIIHLGPNKVYPRFLMFFSGFLTLIAFWTIIVLEVASK